MLGAHVALRRRKVTKSLEKSVRQVHFCMSSPVLFAGRGIGRFLSLKSSPPASISLPTGDYVASKREILCQQAGSTVPLYAERQLVRHCLKTSPVKKPYFDTA